MYLLGTDTIKLPKGSVWQLQRFEDHGGIQTTLTVTRRKSGNGGMWRACVGYKNVAAFKAVPTAGPAGAAGLGRGVVVTVVTSDGVLYTTPPCLTVARDEIAELLRQRAGKTVGSQAWRKINRQVAKAYRRTKHQSDNWARETTHQPVAEHSALVFEDLKLINTIMSARETVETPGKNVATRQSLNRSLRNAALGSL